MQVVDQYSFETKEEKELYFLDKIIEQQERKLENLENQREKMILCQMEKEKGI